MLFELCSPRFRHGFGCVFGRGFRCGLRPAPAPAVFPEQSGSPPVAGRAWRAALLGWLHPGWGNSQGLPWGCTKIPQGQ